METRILPDDDAGVAEAVRLLRQGSLVAFATETVYGLGGMAENPIAIRAIFSAKGRPATDPLILHLPEPDLSLAVAQGWVASPLPNSAILLAQAFWPGPLTLVLPRGPQADPAMTAGLETIAVRCPAHPTARKLLRALAHPLAAPSANRFGRISPTDARAVQQELGGRIPLILDGGPCSVGLESTVICLGGDSPEILRPGGISTTQITQVLGQTPKIRSGSAKPQDAQSSPGQLATHYAPLTPLYLCDQPIRNFLPKTFHLLFRKPSEPMPNFSSCLCPDGNQETAARELYRNLRLADASGAEKILVEPIPDGPWADALRDRLTRASAGTARWTGQEWKIVPRPSS